MKTIKKLFKNYLRGHTTVVGDGHANTIPITFAISIIIINPNY
jgi:hypothetical protein